MSKKLVKALGYSLKNTHLFKRRNDRGIYTKTFEDLIQELGKISFSQSGEDLIIDYIFQLRGVTYPSYIDIGANHPFYLSNTAYFYSKGCRGINIEANPNLIENFTKYRSEDINLNYGVGSKNIEELNFFIINEPTLSTFSQIEVESFEKAGYHIVEVKKVKVYTLNHLLKQYYQNEMPDFFSIDVEGLDFEIIRTIDFNFYRPKVICVESHSYSATGAGKRREDLIQYVEAQNYHEYADTGLNSIFVDKSFWFI